MKLFNTSVAGLIFATSTLFSTANAGLIDMEVALGKQTTWTDGAEITYSEQVDNTYSVASDATFSLTLQGDFNQTDENLAVTIEDLFLGIVLDDNPSNDDFDFSYTYTDTEWIHISGWHWERVETEVEVEDGGLYQTTLKGTATIAQESWADVVSDGTVNILLDASSDVNNLLFIPAFSVSGSIKYAVTDVPEPSTLAIFSLALLGFGARRLSK